MQEELNTRLLQKIGYLEKGECICNINKWFEKESSSCEK